MRDVIEPTHYSKRVGHEVPGVEAVLCECMGGYREGDMSRMGRTKCPFRISPCISVQKLFKKNTEKNMIFLCSNIVS